MKQQLLLSVKSSTVKKSKLLWHGLIALAILALPISGYSQTPAPPNGGSLPDSPLSVPFDNNLNLLLLLAGVVFAAVIMLNMHKDKDAKNRETN